MIFTLLRHKGTLCNIIIILVIMLLLKLNKTTEPRTYYNQKICKTLKIIINIYIINIL